MLEGPAADMHLNSAVTSLYRMYGDPQHRLRFSHPGSPISPVRVYVFTATKRRPVTVFATGGMAAVSMPGGDLTTRAELMLGCRGRLSAREHERVAARLAAVADYPWRSRTPIGWNQVIRVSAAFPLFAGCSALVLTRPFDHPDLPAPPGRAGNVRLIQVVPATSAEIAADPTASATDILRRLAAERDLFSGGA